MTFDLSSVIVDNSNFTTTVVLTCIQEILQQLDVIPILIHGLRFESVALRTEVIGPLGQQIRQPEPPMEIPIPEEQHLLDWYEDLLIPSFLIGNIQLQTSFLRLIGQ